jgi:hypothetical protein
MSDSNEILLALRSSDLSVRIPAVERAARCGADHVEEVVELLDRFPEDGYFVLERIGRFGEAAVAPLLRLHAAARNPQIRLLATLGLAHFRRSVDDLALLECIHERSQYENLACRALAWIPCPSARPALIEELERMSATEGWRVVSLVLAIRALGGAVSKVEEARLRSGGRIEVVTLFESPGVGSPGAEAKGAGAPARRGGG